MKRLAGSLLAATLVWTGPAAAQDVDYVDLELVLAVDVSLSMDPAEQALQREGYVAAFRDGEVLEAIRSGGYGKIAVAYVEWAGAGSQRIIADWTIISDAASADAFAAKLENSQPVRLRRTSISGALLASAAMFERNPHRGLRRVIDVSGDGPNNQGARVDGVRDGLVGRGIVINGLPLLLNRGGQFFDIPDLDRYYRDCVVGGTGAFTLPVRDIEKFGEAIRQKLVLEIAGRPSLVHRAQATANEPQADCLIGEKMWLDWRSRGFMDP